MLNLQHIKKEKVYIKDFVKKNGRNYKILYIKLFNSY